MKMRAVSPISGGRKRRWLCGILFVVVLAALCSPVTQQSSDKKQESKARTDQQNRQAEKAGSDASSDSNISLLVDPADFVGAETCKSCHEEEAKTYDKGPHSKLTSAKHKGPQWQGCEACHGPGREHAESGDPSKIIRFAALTREEASRRCLRCHELGRDHGSHRSHSIDANAGCLDCHSIHGATIRSEAH